MAAGASSATGASATGSSVLDSAVGSSVTGAFVPRGRRACTSTLSPAFTSAAVTPGVPSVSAATIFAELRSNVTSVPT